MHDPLTPILMASFWSNYPILFFQDSDLIFQGHVGQNHEIIAKKNNNNSYINCWLRVYIDYNIPFVGTDELDGGTSYESYDEETQQDTEIMNKLNIKLPKYVKFYTS